MTWWDATTHQDRRPVLLARNRIQTALRAWFLDQGFVEVEPAYLVPSPGNETHLHAVRATLTDPALTPRTAYLHTSPEFAMKKLIAAGETRIFTFARVWRDREGGRRHSTEFTMLEWYRADAPYMQLMQDCASILSLAAEAAGATAFQYDGVTCPADTPPLRMTLADRAAAQGIDLLATLRHDGTGDAAALATQMRAQGIAFQEGETWLDLFSRLVNGVIEPGLPMTAPVILDAFPAPAAALAQRSAEDPRVAERFELFCCGLELANAFGELTDPDEQRARFVADMDARALIYGDRYPLDEDLLAALAHMPPTSGAALGFDRLVMLATGAPRLSDVQWTPPA